MALPTSIQRFLANLFLSPFLLLVLVVLLPLLVVAFVLRTVEACVYSAIDGRRRTSLITNLWVTINKNPRAHGDINGCMVVTGDLSLEKLTALVDSVFNLKDDKGKKVYWQTSRFVKPGYINNYWVEERNFNVSDHVVEHHELIESEEELREIMRQGTTKDYPLKSPWVIKAIPYLQEGVRKTVIHFRIWHGMADGSSLAYLLMLRMADSDAPLDVNQLNMPKYLQMKKFILYIKAIWSLPIVVLENLVFKKEECGFDKGILTGAKCISWTKNLDNAHVKKLKNKLGTTFNDALLALVSTSLSNLFDDVGECCPQKLSIGIPLNTRFHVEDASTFKNKYAGLILQLLTQQKDFPLCALEMNHQMNDIKETCKTITSDILFHASMYFMIPDSFIVAFMKRAYGNISLVVSSLVGPPMKVRLCGHVVEDIMYWVTAAPPPKVCLSIMTYAGKLRMGVECDRGLFVESDKITKSFEKTFKNIKLE